MAQSVTDGYPVAVANDALVHALDHPGVSSAIGAGEIVVLGIVEKATRVEIDGTEYPAREFAVPVLHWTMARVLLPEALVSEFSEPIAVHWPCSLSRVP